MEIRARNGQTEDTDSRVSWKVLLANTPNTHGIGAEVGEVFCEEARETSRQITTNDASPAQKREALEVDQHDQG